jgi:hypothetical protein
LISFLIWILALYLLYSEYLSVFLKVICILRFRFYFHPILENHFNHYNLNWMILVMAIIFFFLILLFFSLIFILIQYFLSTNVLKYFLDFTLNQFLNHLLFILELPHYQSLQFHLFQYFQLQKSLLVTPSITAFLFLIILVSFF